MDLDFDYEWVKIEIYHCNLNQIEYLHLKLNLFQSVLYERLNRSAMRILISLLLLLIMPLGLFAQLENLTLAELKTEYFKKRSSFASGSSKKMTDEQQKELDQIVDHLEKKDVLSFEYNLVVWVNGNYSLDLKENLQTAYALNSSDELVIREMLAYSILVSDLVKQKELLLKVQKFYTPAELAYYQDALPEKKSLVITSNQEDMYGFLIALSLTTKTTGIQIVSLDLMKNESYRKMVVNNSGMDDLLFLGNEKNFIKNMITKGNSKIYISATVPPDYFVSVGDNLFLTGLFYEYGAVDQYALLNAFWNRIQSKDLSQIVLSKSAEKKLYANYLAPLITLYMIEKDDPGLKKMIQSIAAKVGKSTEVENVLKEIDAG